VSVFAREFAQFYERIGSNIFEFVAEHDFVPTEQQRELLQAVQDHADAPTQEAAHAIRKIACKSGQGPGKTTISGFIGVWRAIRFYGAFTVVTAPTMRQCREVWLAEYRRNFAKASPMLDAMIEITATRVIVLGNTDWGCRLVTSTNPQAAQGLHHDHLTVICEEASGISRELVEQFEGTLTNHDALWLMIGNPNTRDCYFFDCFNIDRAKWRGMTWSAEDSVLVDRKTIAEHAEKYGKDSDFFRVRVLGKFPYADPRSVMSSEELEICYKNVGKRYVLMRKKDARGKVPRRIAIDFARFGSDESVIYVRQGNAIIAKHIFSHTEPTAVARKAMEIQRQLKWADKDCLYVLDASGMGQGVLGLFYEARKKVLEFHNGGLPYDGSLYDNRITEAFFTFADKVRAGHVYFPRDNRLLSQLANRWYFTTKPKLGQGGIAKLILETKDDYMKRGHDSPDRADACVMVFYDEGVGTDRVG
jgi:hypothetical protein